MDKQPTLHTDRLELRPFENDDASAIQELAGEREIARYTFVPYPYEDGMAEQFIESCRENWNEGTQASFGITQRRKNLFIGTVGLKRISKEHSRGELGYWIGAPYWGNGYATEAARELLRFAFKKLNLNRVFAFHMQENPASGKVLQKIGMNREGIQKQHIFHFGAYRDLVLYSLLREEWNDIRRR